jgi:hypothetical protein
MQRRSRQSELFDGSAGHLFRPTLGWSRLSFLDLLGEGSDTPLDKLEPAYIDGTTLMAVWPEVGDLTKVEVLLWKPDLDTLKQLHQLQVDWPPALCDVCVRVRGERVEIRPCCTSTARRAQVANTARGEAIRFALDRGARMLGRPLSLAA